MPRTIAPIIDKTSRIGNLSPANATSNEENLKFNPVAAKAPTIIPAQDVAAATEITALLELRIITLTLLQSILCLLANFRII